MGVVNWTELVLGVMTLLGCCGWFVSGRKHRQEIECLKADIRHKDLDLSTEFVIKFRELIAGPLEEEVCKLRTEVNQLRDAIEGVYDCLYRAECPVRDKLRKQQGYLKKGDLIYGKD